LIWLDEIAVAVSDVGAAGTDNLPPPAANAETLIPITRRTKNRIAGTMKLGLGRVLVEVLAFDGSISRCIIRTSCGQKASARPAPALLVKQVRTDSRVLFVGLSTSCIQPMSLYAFAMP
jgi:hypothetical protein